jgi:hypothetical protein
MATKAQKFQQRFKQKATALGYKIVRTRPFYTDTTNTVHPAQIATYHVIDDALRAEKEREFQSVGGGDNQSNDGFKAILFPFDADVVEGDELAIVNTKWTFSVTKADDPFLVGSEVVYWQVQATRKVK